MPVLSRSPSAVLARSLKPQGSLMPALPSADCPYIGHLSV